MADAMSPQAEAVGIRTLRRLVAARRVEVAVEAREDRLGAASSAALELDDLDRADRWLALQAEPQVMEAAVAGVLADSELLATIQHQDRLTLAESIVRALGPA